MLAKKTISCMVKTKKPYNERREELKRKSEGALGLLTGRKTSYGR